MTTRHTGGCLCGGIAYAITGELSSIQICHCGMCRKAQGSAFGANIPIAIAAFDLVRGSELLQEYESSPGKVRVFCRRCGSPIYSRRAASPDVIRVRAGGLDGDVAARPDAHAFVGSKASWWTIADDLPQHVGARPPAGAGR
jgi:hypothetical protein